MPATWRHLLAPLVGLLLVAACAAPSAPATTVPPVLPTTPPVAAAPTTPPAAAAPTTAPKPAVTPLPAAPATTAPAAKPTTAAAAQPTAVTTPATGAVSGEIVVFAASSLTDVFGDMATAFQQANPNAKLTFNFGASSQLATQLGQGARADVFASADQTQMENAKRQMRSAVRTSSLRATAWW